MVLGFIGTKCSKTSKKNESSGVYSKSVASACGYSGAVEAASEPAEQSADRATNLRTITGCRFTITATKLNSYVQGNRPMPTGSIYGLYGDINTNQIVYFSSWYIEHDTTGVTRFDLMSPAHQADNLSAWVSVYDYSTHTFKWGSGNFYLFPQGITIDTYNFLRTVTTVKNTDKLSGYYEDVTNEAYDQGVIEGEESGYNNGFTEGKEEGITEGYQNGYDRGYQDGFTNGKNSGLADGYDQGYDAGYNVGWEEGRAEAVERTLISQADTENTDGIFGSTVQYLTDTRLQVTGAVGADGRLHNPAFVWKFDQTLPINTTLVIEYKYLSIDKGDLEVYYTKQNSEDFAQLQPIIATANNTAYFKVTEPNITELIIGQISNLQSFVIDELRISIDNSAGLAEIIDQSEKQGYDKGFTAGTEEGRQEGFEIGKQEGIGEGYKRALEEGLTNEGIFNSLIAFLKLFFQLATQFLGTKIFGSVTLGMIVIGIPATSMILNLIMGFIKKLLGARGSE